MQDLSKLNPLDEDSTRLDAQWLCMHVRDDIMVMRPEQKGEAVYISISCIPTSLDSLTVELKFLFSSFLFTCNMQQAGGRVVAFSELPFGYLYPYLIHETLQALRKTYSTHSLLLTSLKHIVPTTIVLIYRKR
jgi:hypothetical protein